MASPSTELRPRSALGIVDAAAYFCSRQSGIWALTLPGGALVTWALLELVDRARLHRSLVLPAFAFACAWCVRALCQGAGAYWVEHTLVGTPPSARASFAEALRHAPALIVAAAFAPFIDLALLLISVGVGLLLVGAHSVMYAVAMRGEATGLGLFGACRRALGPAAGSTPGVRLAFATFPLVVLNLHIAANALLWIGAKLFALDLVFADRFASLDNGRWWAVLLGLAFTLTEPMRAACSALLLVDARLRTEGLDLTEGVNRLPTRRRATQAIVAALALVFCRAARAEDPVDRLERAAARCGAEIEDVRPKLRALRNATKTEEAAVNRFVDAFERRARDEDDCEGALTLLDASLSVVRDSRPPVIPTPARARAREILSRPEFEVVPSMPAAAEPAKEKDPSAFWTWVNDVLDRFFRWLSKTSPREPRPNPLSVGGGEAVAQALAVVMVAAVAITVLVTALRSLRRSQAEVAAPDSTRSTSLPEMEDALSRAPESWAGLADELAAQGRFRDAIRSLYLALLARLHRDGAIEYNPTLSNWDYVRRFRGSADQKPRLRELTYRFDVAWYGRLGLSAESYGAFRTLSQPLLAGERADA